MKTYIALLRGINVSGQKKIKMADLKSHLEELYFKNIQTYIQSGNVVFEFEDKPPEELEKAILEKIKEKYAFEVPVLLKTPADLAHILTHNPFLNGRNEDITKLFVTFLFEKPASEKVEKLKEVNYSPEEYVVEEKDIYFFSPNGYGRAKMNNSFFEKKLKVFATTRNWKTVNKLKEMASK